MAPGEVGADQHDEIGLLQILVESGHRVGAECAAVPATADAMQRRELVSILAEPMKPFISLLAT